MVAVMAVPVLVHSALVEVRERMRDVSWAAASQREEARDASVVRECIVGFVN